MVRRQGDPRLAIGYLRASKEGTGLGLEAQRALIEVWGLREGVTVVMWQTDDGVSGGSDIEDRPGLLAALAGLRDHGAGLMVVAKRDRLARDSYVAATIERAAVAAGARVVCADGTANGDDPASAFMRTVLDGAAAYERALIRGRTRAALQQKATKGEFTGGDPPYGFAIADDGLHLVEVDEEQVIIRTARELRALGLSLRGAARTLADRGFRPRHAAVFGPEQIRRMTEPRTHRVAA